MNVAILYKEENLKWGIKGSRGLIGMTS